MANKRIGALTIGQSPRPDLVTPLKNYLSGCDIVEAGALDDLAFENIPDPKDSSYLLRTQMRTGETVLVTESYLQPALQKALEKLETKGVIATILLCAGTFQGLAGTRPVFVPFQIGARMLAALRFKSIGLITPVREQEKPILARWEKLGYRAAVWTADLAVQDQHFQDQLSKRIQELNLDCIVLDFVGYPLDQVNQLRKNTRIPIIDLGLLAITTLASTVTGVCQEFGSVNNEKDLD